MIINLLQRLFNSSTAMRNNLEERQMRELREASQAATVEKEKAAGKKPTRKDITTTSMPDTPYTDDIAALERKFGKLHEGQVISLSLHEALELMPRTRKKSDAYKGLKSELKRSYGVSLNVGGNNNANKQ